MMVEILVYVYYLNCLDHQLNNKGMDRNNENKRLFMTDIKLIRFPWMSIQDFVKGPGGSNILTPKEKSSYFFI